MSASEHLDGKDMQRQHHLLRQYHLGNYTVGGIKRVGGQVYQYSID